MDLELLNYINVGLNWNILKKGRRSMARRPRKTRADTFESGNKKQDPTAFETKKIVDAPLKRRRLVYQSPSPPPQISCLHGDGVLPPGPHTPSVYYEDPSQRYHSSLSRNQKTKSKTRLRNSNTSKATKKVDFSGIELLAAAACSSFIQDNADYVDDDEKVLKEDATPGVDSCGVDIKESVISTESEEKVGPFKGLRLHWDLNTVMDDWEEPCDGLLVKSEENCSEGVKLKLEEGYGSRCKEGVSVIIESCNGGSFGKTSYESIENLGIKTVTSKTSDCESCVSKSDDFCIQEETIVKGESMSNSDEQAVSEEVTTQGGCESPKLLKKKVGSEDPYGSNVTRDEQGQTGGDGDRMEKVEGEEEVAYDSPFEDGELREPKKENMCHESDNINTYKDKDDLGSIENPLSEKVDHGQGQSSSMVKEGLEVEESGCGSREDLVGRNYNSNIEKSYSRSWWDSKKSNQRPTSITRDYFYSPRDGGGYRARNRRPSSSSSERNSGGYEYDDIYSHRAPNRYRFHSQEEDHHHHHLERERERERKVRCYSPPKRSRSRSGSPSIAWHFQKPKNLDLMQPQKPSSKFTDKRHSRIGYPNDHLRFTHNNYKDKNNDYTYTRK